VYRDYNDKVNFFYVYKSVQHPEINNFVSAFTLEERLKHVGEAKRRFQTEIPWICDSMENSIKKAFGGAPNGEFVIDPDGKIVRKRFWSMPSKLRADLEELVGKSLTTTAVEDLPAVFTPEVRDIASGVVPRIELPGGLSPLMIEPQADEENPFFVKLRVEATRGLLQKGEGQIYFAAYLDPLYKVHWNNRAGKVIVKVKPVEGQDFEKTDFAGPDVEEDADIDPRQFLVNVSLDDKREPFEVTLTYTVCDDAETFCSTVTQSYIVNLKPTRDLGSRPGIFMPAMFAKMRELDHNGDGNLTTDELPEGEVSLYIGHVDYNGNDVIEKAEIDNFLQMFNNGRGFDSSNNDGQK
jgi:hypothetical protein